MMKRAVNRIAAGGGISSGERIGKRWGIRGQQRKERCYRQKLSRNVSEIHESLAIVLPRKAQVQPVLFVHVLRKKVPHAP
jgi:hypothetical protein